MILCDKTYEEELDLVEEATETERGEIALRHYLEPLVLAIAERYGSPGRTRREHLRAGWLHLHFALEKYLERARTDFESGEEEPYKFSTYFSWFARQGITTPPHER